MKISSIFKNTTILTDGRSWRRNPDDETFTRDRTSKYKIKDIVDEPSNEPSVELEIPDEASFKGKDKVIKVPHLNCIILVTVHWQYRQSLRHSDLDIAIEKLSKLFERNYEVISKLPYGSEFGLIDSKNYKTVFTKRRSKNGITVYSTKTLLSPHMNLRPSQYFFRESAGNSVFLKDLVKMSVGMPDADFWVRRSGQLKTLGEPSKQFDPDKIGIKVTATTIIDPNYLYYVFMHLQNRGEFAKLATGSTGLQHIKIRDLAKIPFALSESLNENDEDAPIRIRLRGNEDTARRWIKNVYAQYPENPLNHRQHVMQFGDNGYVVFELEPSFNRRGAVEVKWISAHPQRKGLGSKALKTLQDLAQKSNVILTLYPWEKGEISQRDLKRYYKKQGFKGEGGGSDYMKWDPLSEDDTVTFAGKDPKSFTSPNGGKAAMVIVTAQGSRYLITDDGMVLRHKSFHANTGGEDQGLKDWSQHIEFYDPNEKVGGTTFPLAVSAAVSKRIPVALSTTPDGRRALAILDNGKWRVAKISDVFKHVATDDVAIVGNYSKSPKLHWHTMDYDVNSNGQLSRVHPGSPVSHGAAIKHAVAEGDYDDMEYDDDKTPDIEGATKYIQDVKRDFDQFGELPITGILNDLEFLYHLDQSMVDKILQPVKDDIVIYINTEFGKGGHSIYGAVRRLDKLHRSGISWPEIYRMLDNQKHSIIKYMLWQIKKGATGMTMEMTIILKRMGIDWSELTAIDRSLRANSRITEADVNGYNEKELAYVVKKALERGDPAYAHQYLNTIGLKAADLPEIKQFLDEHKTHFIKILLELIKEGYEGGLDYAKYLVYNLKRHGFDWPELDIIDRSVKQLSESDSYDLVGYDALRKNNIDKVLKSFKLGAWNGFKSLDFFSLKAAEVPGAVDALEAFKEQFVKMLLTRMKSGDYGDVGTARNLAHQMQSVGMRWPELDVVIKSANKAFDDYDKSLGND